MASMKAVDNLTIGIVIPEQEIDGISPDAYTLLQSKLEKMLSASGITALGGDFVMYPTVNVIEENLIEGGIKNFYKVKIDLTLNVADVATKTIFSSETWPLQGTSERVKSSAVKNAFTGLKGNDPHFKDFIAATKVKIAQYYEANKDAILSKASSLAARGEYEEAIAMLSSYPSSVAGYDEALSLMNKVHTQYVNKNAASIMNEARAAYATKDYATAVNLAAQIDPSSSHYDSAKSLINQVRATINNEQESENQRAMKALEMAADLEKTRINAAASIAKSYYKSRVVHYHVLRY